MSWPSKWSHAMPVVSLALLCTTLTLLGAEWTGPIFILSVGILVGLFLTTLCVEGQEREFVISVFLSAIAARICFILPFYILSYAGRSARPGYFFANDGIAYSENGWQIAKIWAKGLPLDSKALFITQTGTSPHAYDFWNAFVYSFTGRSPIGLYFINALVGAVSSLLVYMFARRYFGLRAARIALVLSAFWPSLFFWSTQNLRDPLINMAIFLLIWSLVEARRGLNVLFLILAGAAIYLLRNFRLQVLLPIFCVVCFWLIWTARSRYLLIASLIGAQLLLTLLRNTEGVGVEHMLRHLVLEPSVAPHFSPPLDAPLLNWLHYLRSVRASGQSAFLPDILLDVPGRVFFFMPLILSYGILAPFPWQVGSAFFLIGAVEMTAFYLCIPFIVKGYLKCRQEDYSLTLLMLLLFLSFSVLLAMIDSNLGILFRHRSMTLYFVLIFLAAGLSFTGDKGRVA